MNTPNTEILITVRNIIRELASRRRDVATNDEADKAAIEWAEHMGGDGLMNPLREALGVPMAEQFLRMPGQPQPIEDFEPFCPLMSTAANTVFCSRYCAWHRAEGCAIGYLNNLDPISNELARITDQMDPLVDNLTDFSGTAIGAILAEIRDRI